MTCGELELPTLDWCLRPAEALGAQGDDVVRAGDWERDPADWAAAGSRPASR